MRRISVNVLSLVMSALGLSACSAASADEAWVTKYAAERLACPKEQITVTTMEFNYWEASGCGKSDKFIKVCIATSCKLNTMADLSTRASFDLGCAEDQLQIAKLDRDTMGVTGCGQRATYKPTLEGWVMNASTTVGETSEPPPASTEPAAEPADSAEPADGE